MATPLTPAFDAEQFDFVLSSGIALRGYLGEARGGVPLVLLHSINAAPTAIEMFPLFQHYRSSRKVWAPDLPGFGISDREPLPYSSSLYARWLAEWLKTFDEAPDVVALSLTGEFVARAVLEYGVEIRSLTLISPTGMGKDISSGIAIGSWVDRFVASTWLGSPLFRLLTGKLSIRWFLGQSFVDAPARELIDYAWETARQPGAHWAPLKFLTFGMFTEQAISRLYSRLEMPCLIIYDRDPNISFERLPQLLESSSFWIAERLAPSLGLPHWELTSETIASLEKFWTASK